MPESVLSGCPDWGPKARSAALANYVGRGGKMERLQRSRCRIAAKRVRLARGTQEREREARARAETETGSQPEIAQAPGRATSFEQLAIEEASGFKASSFTPRSRG